MSDSKREAVLVFVCLVVAVASLIFTLAMSMHTQSVRIEALQHKLAQKPR